MSLDSATAITWLADHSLRVAVLVAVVGAGSILARRASAHSRLFAWTVVLYSAAAMPLLASVLPKVPVPVVFTEPVIVVPGRDSVVAGPFRQAGERVPASHSPSPLPWLLVIYLAGTSLLITRLLAGTHLTRRLLRRAQPVDHDALVAEVQGLSSAMGLPRVPRVVQHTSVHVPFVCGVLRPTIVLPDTWNSWDAATRQAVLTHELSHLMRRDLWTLRAASFYCAVTWMNPMSWWLRRKLDTLAERASDDEVLASGADPTAYAEILVQFFDAAQRAPGRASWQLAMARRGGVEAQKRVGRVLDAREGGNVRFGISGRVLVGVAVVLAAVPVIALSASGPEVVAIEPPPAIVHTASPVRIVVTPEEQEPEPWHSARKATDTDVVVPTLTYHVNPKYTPDALRAKIQGMVAVEAIVSPEGNVTAARVIKSLDKDLGLDDEAVKTAMLWKFVPGTYQGQPVATRVMIEMEFRLHRSPSRP